MAAELIALWNCLPFNPAFLFAVDYLFVHLDKTHLSPLKFDINFFSNMPSNSQLESIVIEKLYTDPYPISKYQCNPKLLFVFYVFHYSKDHRRSIARESFQILSFYLITI